MYSLEQTVFGFKKYFERKEITATKSRCQPVISMIVNINPTMNIAPPIRLTIV